MNEFRRLAAKIDLHIQQLAAQGGKKLARMLIACSVFICQQKYDCWQGVVKTKPIRG